MRWQRRYRPGRAVVYEGDVRDADSLRSAGSDFIARFGSPDVVIANAGISRGALTDHEEDLATFRVVLDTNVVGLVHTFAPFVAAMRTAGRGALVGIASIAGFRGLPGSGAYSASKAAAIAVSRESAHRAAGERRRRAHDLPRLHQNADDHEESLSDAVPAGSGHCRAAHRPRHRAPAAVLRAAVADGDRRARAADTSAPDLRRAVRARAAEAAATRVRRSAPERAVYKPIRKPTVTAQ
jgi:hypothetical protein